MCKICIRLHTYRKKGVIEKKVSNYGNILRASNIRHKYNNMSFIGAHSSGINYKKYTAINSHIVHVFNVLTTHMCDKRAHDTYVCTRYSRINENYSNILSSNFKWIYLYNINTHSLLGHDNKSYTY